MPRSIFTGKGRLYIVADPTGAGTVVNLTTPTATSINTGTEVTKWLRRDGLKTPQSGNTVDTSDASSRFNSTGLGTYGGDAVELGMYRDTLAANDNAWPLLKAGLYLFLAVFRFGTTGASPASGDRCEIWQCGVISREMQDIGDNDPNRFVARLAVVNPPNDDATLAT